MATPTQDAMTHEEFDRRLDTSNERLRLELVEAQERVQRLEALIARKEVFVRRLAQVLIEIEREENEIAALEKGLRSPRATTRRRSPTPQAPQ